LQTVVSGIIHQSPIEMGLRGLRITLAIFPYFNFIVVHIGIAYLYLQYGAVTAPHHHHHH